MMGTFFADLRKALAVVGPAHYGTVAYLLALMVVGSALEVLGIGLVLPVITTLVQPDAWSRYDILHQISDFLGNPPDRTLTLILLGCLISGYLVKNVYRVVLIYVQTRFAFRQQAEISQRLYRGYLARPYAFHLQRNSAELIRNITTESDLFSLLVVLPGLRICAESVVTLSIFVFLLFVNFSATLTIIAIFGSCSVAFYIIVQRRLVRWGKSRQRHDMERLKQAQQGLGGVKDVKVLGRESSFHSNFAEQAYGRSLYEGRSYFLGQLPVVWLEMVAITTVVSLFVMLVLSNVPFDEIIPTLALYAAAALRVMPSLNKILADGQQLRYCKPVIDTLHSELDAIEAGENADMRGAGDGCPGGFDSISIKGLSFRYAGADADALSGVDLAISRGQSVGIIGTTGSGKTTLIDLTLGLLTPTGGDILADEKSIFEDVRRWQRNIGYVPQSIYLADQTLRENVAFGVPASEIDDEAVQRAVRMAQLDPLIDSLPEGLETEVGERGVRLSGGQRQRVGIARALYHDPQLIVLDEATAALDTETEQAVMDAVRSLSGKKTLIMIAHRLSTVSACDMVYRLESGQVVWSGKLNAGEPGVVLPPAVGDIEE
jgi:ATP-binding cassette, subfamily B, bacterial PglK